jgi:hypothetical protein
MNTTLGCCQRTLLALPMLLALCAAGSGAPLAGKDLTAALQRGGYVILMRHASSPATAPEPSQADPGNPQHERQLDEAGRTSARAMGDAMRRLRIPIGQVLSSPTYRALETARLANLGPALPFSLLGDAGPHTTSHPGGAHGVWLRGKVAQAPQAGTNTLIITQAPNIMEAFPAASAQLAEGEALIFRPDGNGDAPLVAHVKIQEWPRLAENSSPDGG